MDMFHSMLIIILFTSEFSILTSCPISCTCKNNGKFVKCKDKNLISIPINIPSNVEHLDLSKNIFNNLAPRSFVSLTNLRVLRLDHCEIKLVSNTTFDGLVELKNLYLTNNDIKDLHPNTFKDMKKLLHLYLSNNEFETVPDLVSFSLTRLNLDGNHISSAQINRSFKLNTELRTLILTNNKIGSINSLDFSNLRNSGLQSLMLKMNNIVHIHAEAFSPLKYSLQNLELEGNNLLTSKQLEVALQAFNGGSHIHFLELRHTGLTKISRSFFQPFVDSNLNRLDIGNNAQLSSIDEDAFSKLEKVQIFIADKCNISSVNIRFSSLIALLKLDLSHNKFVKFPHRLPGSVETLDFSYNEIRIILRDDLKSLSSLRSLQLSNNAISNIELGTFSDLTQLTFLDLSLNRIKTIESGLFSGMPSLHKLDLHKQSSCLKTIAANSFMLPKLLTLNLDNNCLDNMTIRSSIFRGCGQISNISLVRNGITYIDEALFKESYNLSFLDLSHNDIHGWSPGTFAEISATLIDINLSFNYINVLSTIPTAENFLPRYFKRLRVASFYDNYWNCTCFNVKWLLDHKRFLSSPDKLLCQYPPAISGRKLFDLKDMMKCPVDSVIPGVNILEASNRNGVIAGSSIGVILLLILAAIVVWFARRRLYRFSRQIRRRRYKQMSTSSFSPHVGYSNNLITDDTPDMGDNHLVIDNIVPMVEPPPLSTISSKSSSNTIENTNDLIMDQDIPPIDSFNSNISSFVKSSFEEIHPQFIVFLVEDSSYDFKELIESVRTIPDLKSHEHRHIAYHCRILIVKYPPIDREIITDIVRKRQGEYFDDYDRKVSHIFFDPDCSWEEDEEMVELFGSNNFHQYTSCNIVEEMFTCIT